MALEDLDLEFEDEEAEKKSDAVSIDVDLEFGTDTSIGISKPAPVAAARPVAKPQAITPKAAGSTKPNIVAKTPTGTDSNVRPINAKPRETTAPIRNVQAATVGSSALKEETLAVSESDDAIELLKARVEQIELEAQIKIAVAEFKTDILSDLLSDIKLLEHQIGGLLGRIHTKHPDLKQEVLMIKKLLSDFSSKKRK